MKTYTKAGDLGDTGLASGERLRKSSLRIEAYGSVDELNSWLGLTLTELSNAREREIVLEIQNDLHKVMAELSKPLKKFESVSEKDIEILEKLVDEFDSQLPPLTQFILPGGTKTAGLLHVCRTVCRRAERNVVRLAETELVDKTVIKYLNRLGDFLFVFARKINRDAGKTEQHPNY